MRLAKNNFDRTNQLRAIDGLVTAHTAVGRYERAFDLLEQRLTLAQRITKSSRRIKIF